MPLVLIRKDPLTVLARMDTEEMVHPVKVSVYFYVSQAISSCRQNPGWGG